jgi:DUF4097 and DUF4098 domain-containing protein YvlB
MTAFDTPNPITASIELPLGTVHLIATKRTDTVVVVNPTDPSRTIDLETAERVDLDLSKDTLIVKVPKTLRDYISLSKPGSVDVTIELPEGSRVEITAGLADVRVDGSLARVNVRCGAGDVHLDETGPLDVSSGAGKVAVNRVAGNGEITTAGDMEIGIIDGNAEIKNLNGRTWLGEVSGHLQVKSANGDIMVDRARSDVDVKTANGNIDLGEVFTGSTTLETAAGSLQIGIATDTTAWVDARTRFGRIHNTLESAGGPESSGETVEVRARTSFGDITIHRSPKELNQRGEI